MNTFICRSVCALTALCLLIPFSGCSSKREPARSNAAVQADRAESARDALERLYLHTPAARKLSANAAGVLVFPEITKGGFVVGGQFGRGVLFKGGEVAGFYNSTAASYGLQAGIQRFGYAMFFMTDEALDFLKRSEGWEVGVGPNITVVDAGIARALTTTTAQDGVYVFFFEQRGLMAGLGVQGTKITRTDTAG